MINIKTNIDKFIKTEIKNMNNAVKKATTSASTKTAAQGLTFAKRTIREDYNIKAADLGKVMKKTKAYKGRHASIIATGRGIALSKFRARQLKKGVSVSVKKGTRKLLPGRFIATMKSGHKGVYTRKSKTRLPIKELYGPGAATLFGSRRVMRKTVSFIRQKYPVIYEQNLKYFMGKN